MKRNLKKELSGRKIDKREKKEEEEEEEEKNGRGEHSEVS
jgi:hypothetical protein